MLINYPLLLSAYLTHNTPGNHDNYCRCSTAAWAAARTLWWTQKQWQSRRSASDVRGFTHFQRTDFDYIWHGTSRNHHNYTGNI